MTVSGQRNRGSFAVSMWTKLRRLWGPNMRGRIAYSLKRRQLEVERRVFEWQHQKYERLLETRSHEVPLSEIRFATRTDFDPARYRNKVLGGDWDIETIPIEETDFFQSYSEAIQDGKPWHETIYVRRMVEEVKSGKVKWGCETEEQLLKRYSYLGDLYSEMGRTGYFGNGNEDEITVNIGRHGDLLFNDGRHRLTFARLLEIPEIPVIITVRHKNWVNFKSEILQWALLNNNRVYAPLLHPDLEWIPSHYGHKRFELMRGGLTASAQTQTLLDIGCHWGYFCHRFESLGYQCTGIEFDSTNFYFLGRLRRAGNRRFDIYNMSIFDYLENSNRSYSVVLALAIFHHFLKTETDFYRLTYLLQNLNMRQMFFMPHHPHEAQMVGAYRNFSHEEFVEFILANSCLDDAHFVGYAEDARPIYRLTSSRID